MFVSGLHVCHECAKAIIQTGITKVVAECSEVKPHWKDSLELTKAMFIEAGIEYITRGEDD
jgi:dCMP deaminase